MKKSRLQRRTPLKRGTSKLKRTRLARVSVTKATWRQLYRMKRDGERKPIMTCADCLGIFPGDQMEPHHPAGRHDARLLVFVWLCKSCHERCHHEAKWARSTGRILKEIEGGTTGPNNPNYFNISLESLTGLR